MKKRLLLPILARIILLFFSFDSLNFVFAGDSDPGDFPEAITVKGVINDQQGKPLAGANISEKNANTAVTIMSTVLCG